MQSINISEEEDERRFLCIENEHQKLLMVGLGQRDTSLVTDMTKEEQEKIMAWIHKNILPRKTPLLDYSSYGIKDLVEHELELYITNNQFKDAMLLCGFYPVDEHLLNWNYCISKKSPAFKKMGW